MDEDNSPIKHDGENARPVVWTPEDASRFLSTAIQEAQKPLADALKQRPATTSVLVLIVAILVAASVAIGWILFSQLSKSESSAQSALSARDSAVAKQFEMKTKADTLEASLIAAKEDHERLSDQVEGKRDSEEGLRKAQTELVRYRRQNDLLRTQIAGLELEKQALSRQLEAVKAMAIDEGFDDYVTIEDQPIPGSVPSETPAVPMKEPQSPPMESPETTTSKVEPPAKEAPKLGDDKTASPREMAPDASEPPTPEAVPTPESQVSISGTDTTQAPAGTVTVESVAEGGSEAGTLAVGANGQNPPTLYESSRMIEAGASEEAATGPIQITSSTPLSEPEAEKEESAKEETGESPEISTGPETEKRDIDEDEAGRTREVSPESAPRETEPEPVKEEAAFAEDQPEKKAPEAAASEETAASSESQESKEKAAEHSEEEAAQ